MSLTKKKLKQYKDEFSKHSKCEAILAGTVMDMLEELQDDLEQDEKESSWIPVEERLPEEYDSIFAKYKGTPGWKPNILKKFSPYVIATAKYKGEIMIVRQAYTVDGKWRAELPLLVEK